MIIGLTGTFASGKSTASQVFKENGFVVIDVDKIGHYLLETEKIKNKLIKKFGKDILTYEDKIDRKKLGDIVFNSNEKLNMLNKIMHREMKKEIKKIIKENKEKNILIDAALLFEMELNKWTDINLLIKSDLQEIINRGKKRNGFSEEKIQKIISSQIDIDKKEQLTDSVIENNSSIDELKNKVLLFIKRLKSEEEI